eukprot:Awhi_evm1s15139
MDSSCMETDSSFSSGSKESNNNNNNSSNNNNTSNSNNNNNNTNNNNNGGLPPPQAPKIKTFKYHPYKPKPKGQRKKSHSHLQLHNHHHHSSSGTIDNEPSHDVEDSYGGETNFTKLTKRRSMIELANCNSDMDCSNGTDNVDNNTSSSSLGSQDAILLFDSSVDENSNSSKSNNKAANTNTGNSKSSKDARKRASVPVVMMEGFNSQNSTTQDGSCNTYDYNNTYMGNKSNSNSNKAMNVLSSDGMFMPLYQPSSLYQQQQHEQQQQFSYQVSSNLDYPQTVPFSSGNSSNSGDNTLMYQSCLDKYVNLTPGLNAFEKIKEIEVIFAALTYQKKKILSEQQQQQQQQNSLNNDSNNDVSYVSVPSTCNNNPGSTNNNDNVNNNGSCFTSTPPDFNSNSNLSENNFLPPPPPPPPQLYSNSHSSILSLSTAARSPSPSSSFSYSQSSQITSPPQQHTGLSQSLNSSSLSSSLTPPVVIKKASKDDSFIPFSVPLETSFPSSAPLSGLDSRGEYSNDFRRISYDTCLPTPRESRRNSEVLPFLSSDIQLDGMKNDKVTSHNSNSLSSVGLINASNNTIIHGNNHNNNSNNSNTSTSNNSLSFTNMGLNNNLSSKSTNGGIVKQRSMSTSLPSSLSFRLQQQQQQQQPAFIKIDDGDEEDECMESSEDLRPVTNPSFNAQNNFHAKSKHTLDKQNSSSSNDNNSINVSHNNNNLGMNSLKFTPPLSPDNAGAFQFQEMNAHIRKDGSRSKNSAAMSSSPISIPISTQSSSIQSSFSPPEPSLPTVALLDLEMEKSPKKAKNNLTKNLMSSIVTCPPSPSFPDPSDLSSLPLSPDDECHHLNQDDDDANYLGHVDLDNFLPLAMPCVH